MKPTKEQLDIINSRLPGTKMSAAQVEVLPFRVFDNNVTDRFTIMSTEMMAKVTQDLNLGKAAFNKLHQSRQELPVGRSVNARMIMVSPEQRREVHANMYAVVQNMDGTCSDDGKELADKYNTGAVYACSAGVTVGFYKCNICGNDIRDYNKCEHVLGRMYSVDEQPKQCMALMTGRNIQDGMAMDCGIYEVSAVTAGGVANAGVLTETFGKYSDGVDIGEFKKGAFADTKALNARITFEAYQVPDTTEPKQERTSTMDKTEVEALIQAQFGTIQADKAKLEVEYKHLEENFKSKETEFAVLKTDLDTANTTIATNLATYEAEKATISATFATEKAALEADKAVYLAEKTALEAFKAEYIELVTAAGNKVSKTAEYATMTLDALKALNVEYGNELNKLFPTGRQSADHTADEAEYSGVPDSVYKTDK